MGNTTGSSGETPAQLLERAHLAVLSARVDRLLLGELEREPLHYDRRFDTIAHARGPETEFTAPYELAESDARSAAAARLGDLDLQPGRPFAYLFDFGDQWRVLLELRERVPPDPGTRYPKVLERRGEPPPQYTYDEAD